MSEYIDLVCCKHEGNPQPFLFRAPAWSNLKKGDGCIVETKNGQYLAKVENCITISPNSDSDELLFILQGYGATLPLKKVLKKITYKEFKYEEDENE